MTILIRLDISKEIGTGHFRRILNLSKSMSNYNFIFIIKTDDKNNPIFKNLNIIFIENDENFINIIYNTTFILLIIDLLHYQKNHIREIKNIINCPLVTFHEYDDYSDYSDLIINYNFIEKYSDKYSNKYLFGSEYIIFSDNIVNYKNRDKEDYIFVSFGGSDPSGLTELFIKKVAEKLPNYNFKIHIGNFKENKNKKLSNIEYLYKPNDIFEYMSRAKLAVSSAGNMMYELIFFKVPSLIIAHNEHQAQFAKNAYEKGCIEYLGKVQEFDSNKLIERILTMNNKKYNYNIIDSKGKDRIIKSIEGLIN